MAKNVLTTSIVANRELEPGDNIEKLARHIRDSGLQHPILVIEHTRTPRAVEYELVDGLRRLEAIRSLGTTSLVLVEVVSSFTELVGHLERAAQYGVEAAVLTPRRAWQLKQFAVLTKSMEMGAIRALGGTRLTVPKGPLSDVNGYLSRALGAGKSGSFFAHASYLYGSLDSGDGGRRERAEQVIPEVEAGRVGLFRGTEIVSGRAEPHLIHGYISSVSEQRAAFTAALASVRGVLKGLEKVGPVNSRMDVQEFSGYVNEFTKLRNGLSVFARRLRKEFEER